jgi:hypothetical protein
MDNLKRVTKQPLPTPGGGTKIKDVASENYLKVSEALFKQTHTTYNYRITFMDWMVTLAQRYLEESKAELSAPNRFGIDDDMKSKTKILYAELLLLESSLEQRWSRYIYFINQSRTLDHNKIKSDPDMLGKLRDRIVEADKQLPESSYLKIELAFARATLELSIDTSQLGAAYRQRVYKTIDLLTANPPDLSADYPDPTYRVIKYLEALRPRIMAQPEPNRTILLNQLQTKLALAHIILAANLADSFPGKMNYCIEKIGRHGNSPEGRECKIFIKYSRKAAKIAQNILRDLESKTDARITQSGEPLMFDLHDFRAELYHQLSIAYAFLDDGPQMEHYLALAKEENIASNSRFNVYYRSWILNSFAIPKPMRSEQEMRFMIDVDNPVKGILFEQRAKRKD